MFEYLFAFPDILLPCTVNTTVTTALSIHLHTKMLFPVSSVKKDVPRFSFFICLLNFIGQSLLDFIGQSL